MAYNWEINVNEINTYSDPKLIQYSSNTDHKINRKEKNTYNII